MGSMNITRKDQNAATSSSLVYQLFQLLGALENLAFLAALMERPKWWLRILGAVHWLGSSLWMRRRRWMRRRIAAGECCSVVVDTASTLAITAPQATYHRYHIPFCLFRFPPPAARS